MHEAGNYCPELLEKTANALNDDVVNVMLLAVQKKNLELSINVAVTKSVFLYRKDWKKPHFKLGLAQCLKMGKKKGWK